MYTLLLTSFHDYIVPIWSGTCVWDIFSVRQVNCPNQNISAYNYKFFDFPHLYESSMSLADIMQLFQLCKVMAVKPRFPHHSVIPVSGVKIP